MWAALVLYIHVVRVNSHVAISVLLHILQRKGIFKALVLSWRFFKNCIKLVPQVPFSSRVVTLCAVWQCIWWLGWCGCCSNWQQCHYTILDKLQITTLHNVLVEGRLLRNVFQKVSGRQAYSCTCLPGIQHHCPCSGYQGQHQWPEESNSLLHCSHWNTGALNPLPHITDHTLKYGGTLESGTCGGMNPMSVDASKSLGPGRELILAWSISMVWYMTEWTHKSWWSLNYE